MAEIKYCIKCGNRFAADKSNHVYCPSCYRRILDWNEFAQSKKQVLMRGKCVRVIMQHHAKFDMTPHLNWEPIEDIALDYEYDRLVWRDA